MLQVQFVVFCIFPAFNIANCFANVKTLDLLNMGEVACDRHPVYAWTSRGKWSIINIRVAHSLCHCD